MITAFTIRAPRTRVDWSAVKHSISIDAVAVALLGDPPGRGGSSGPWWRCPFHDDRNPSFRVDPSRGSWRCFGCGARGDAVDLVRRLENLDFPAAVRRAADLCGLDGRTDADRSPVRLARTRPAVRPTPTKREPWGLRASDASIVVREASERLWRPEGRPTLEYLRGRGLDDETIRRSRLGCVHRLEIPKAAGGTYKATGATIPWFDGDRLTLVKVRLLPPWSKGGRAVKYASAFGDSPTVFPSPETVQPGRPLVMVEGEFDCLLLARLIGDLAAVVTLGSAAEGIARIDDDLLVRIVRRDRLFIAHDADARGDEAAEPWLRLPNAVRVRPPAKDWTDAHRLGFNVVRNLWLGILKPPGPSWEELQAERWGDPDDDPELGCVRDDPGIDPRGARP